MNKEEKKYNRIKSVLVEKGVDQKELAELLGVHKNSVSRWCTNEAQPSLETLYDIASALKCHVSDLIGEERGEVSETAPNTTPLELLEKKLLQRIEAGEGKIMSEIQKRDLATTQKIANVIMKVVKKSEMPDREKADLLNLLVTLPDKS